MKIQFQHFLVAINKTLKVPQNPRTIRYGNSKRSKQKPRPKSCKDQNPDKVIENQKSKQNPLKSTTKLTKRNEDKDEILGFYLG